MKKYVGALLLIVVFGAAFFFLRFSDELQLKKNLVLMAEFCTTEVGEPVLTFAKKVSSATALCTDPCQVEIASLKIKKSYSLQELRDNILLMKKRLAGTGFSFDDPSIDLTDEAHAEITATLLLNGQNVNGRFTDAYEVLIGARKVEKKWLFSSFTVVEFMER